MGLKDLLLQRAGNLAGSPVVTGKAVSNQSGNLGSSGNLENGEDEGETTAAGTSGGENRLTRLLLDEVTKVTEVTAVKTKGKSGNLMDCSEIAKVTARDVPAWYPPKPLAEGSLVQRLVAAGATVRTWSNGRGGQASIEAPAGIPAELVVEVEARGWRIIPGGRANTEANHDSWLAGVPVAELHDTHRGPTR